MWLLALVYVPFIYYFSSLYISHFVRLTSSLSHCLLLLLVLFVEKRDRTSWRIFTKHSIHSQFWENSSVDLRQHAHFSSVRIRTMRKKERTTKKTMIFIFCHRYVLLFAYFNFTSYFVLFIYKFFSFFSLFASHLLHFLATPSKCLTNEKTNNLV